MRDDDFTADEVSLDESDETDNLINVVPKASKAWRSIERYREMKELRQHLDDLLCDDKSDLKDLRW